MLIKAFLTGWVVLIVAILVNYIAMKIGITTWYSFLENSGKIGFLRSITESSVASKLFLLVVYPAVLGLTAFLTLRYLK